MRVAGNGAPELAIRQKDNFNPTYFVLEDSRCHSTSQRENIGHVSLEAAASGVIGLVEEGDITEICVRSVASIWL
jgi:dihydroxyacid dehydratase/phosphogluconate dehydratase